MAKPQGGNQAPSEEPQSGESQDAAPAQGRPSAREYKSTGKFRVRTLGGHQVVPSDTSLPIINAVGVNMSEENATKVKAEYPQYVFVEQEKEGSN